MATPFIPVETILKVDDNELIANNTKGSEPTCTSTNYVSIGTQCDWKVETSEDKVCSLLPVTDSNGAKYDLINSNITFGERSEDLPLVIRGWPTQCDTSMTSEQKFIIPASFSQQFACNIQTLPIDEKFFLQFDYKTRNKLKTKQRRLDPYYRTQERVRQRTVMRIKRQDPRFRAAEREKGRYRMRLKRLDPVFRSQERERQRERMKLKRSNPDFREREREQQKTRLHIKRLDPAYKEKERAQDLLRMRLKRQNESIYASEICDEKIKINSKTETTSGIAESVFKEVDDAAAIPEIRNNQVMFHDGFNTKLLSIRPREPSLETFHFKKQHILNFNFYNSSKEQWPAPGEITIKSSNEFADGDDTVKLEGNDLTGDDANALEKSKYFLSRKTLTKHSLINHPLIDLKSETQALSDMEKGKESLVSDSPAIPSYTSSSGN